MTHVLPCSTSIGIVLRVLNIGEAYVWFVFHHAQCLRYMMLHIVEPTSNHIEHLRHLHNECQKYVWYSGIIVDIHLTGIQGITHGCIYVQLCPTSIQLSKASNMLANLLYNHMRHPTCQYMLHMMSTIQVIMSHDLIKDPYIYRQEAIIICHFLCICNVCNVYKTPHSITWAPNAPYNTYVDISNQHKPCISNEILMTNEWHRQARLTQ